jgi:alpha-D-ribose 1-methylphosphonate 5-triphosphate synthase subunit PhnL
MNSPVLQVQDLSKSFTLHHQGEVSFHAFEHISFDVTSGECVVLVGESGAGKSTLLRCLYANYLSDSGNIVFHDGDNGYRLNDLSQRSMIRLRRHKIAYVSQFLRVIPRVPALSIVIQPLLELGFPETQADERARQLLQRLHIPERLWSLSPTTFSGGEQQRINIAREFAVLRPLMLLDEPTASLDAENRQTVIELILEAKAEGCAIVGIFHDEESRAQVADRLFYLNTEDTR